MNIDISCQVFFEFWILLMNGMLCSLLFPIDSFLFCFWMDSPALCRRCCFVLCAVRYSFLLPLWWLLERAVKVHRNMMTALIGSLQVHLAALPQVQCGWLLEDPTQSSTAASSSSEWRLLDAACCQVRSMTDCSTPRVKFARWLLEAIPCPGDPKFIRSLTARSTSRAR